jgi:hypothetical protein
MCEVRPQNLPMVDGQIGESGEVLEIRQEKISMAGG